MKILMTMKKIFSVVAISILLFGCSIFKKENTLKIDEPTVPLLATTWYLINSNNQAIEINAEKPMKLKLAADNTFKGFGSCNQIWGVCKIMQSQIEFSHISRTKMACQNMDDEITLLATLKQTKAYFISGNKLQLIDNNTNILATFQAADNEKK